MHRRSWCITWGGNSRQLLKTMMLTGLESADDILEAVDLDHVLLDKLCANQECRDILALVSLQLNHLHADNDWCMTAGAEA